MKLYEYAKEIEELDAYLDQYAEDHDGEIPIDLDDKLDALKLGKEDKLESCGQYYKSLVAEAMAHKTEALAQTEKRRRLERKAEKFKEYMTRCLDDGEKLKTPTVVLSWRKSESLKTYDDTAIPEKYLVIKKEPNKTLIKKALKDEDLAKDIDFAYLETKQNLQIK